MLNLLKYKNQIIIHYIIQIYKYVFFLINHKHILFMLNNMINEQLMHQFIFLLYRYIILLNSFLKIDSNFFVSISYLISKFKSLYVNFLV